MVMEWLYVRSDQDLVCPMAFLTLNSQTKSL